MAQHGLNDGAWLCRLCRHIAMGDTMPHAITPTFYLPAECDWTQTTSAFGATRLPIVSPTPNQLGALAAQLAAAADGLRQIPIAQIVAALDRVAVRWLDPELPERRALATVLPSINNYSPAMVQHVVGRMVQDWRAKPLWARLESQFSNPAVLDDWQIWDWGSGIGDRGLGIGDRELKSDSRLRSRAWGPRLTVHMCAGNVPGVAIQSLIDALLVKSPSLLKPATGEPLWAALWVRMLVAELPALAPALAVVWWAGGAAELEAAVLHHAEAVIANASNETIADLRRRLPAHVRLLDYGSRISFAAVARERITSVHLPELARALAYDLALFEQSGCVSPQMIFIESQDATEIAALVAALDAALAELDRTFPHTPTSSTAAAVRRFRDEYEWRMLAGASVSLVGPADCRWTIISDEQANLAPTPGGRTVVVRPIADVAHIPALFGEYRSYLQSVALAANEPRFSAIASQFAAAGISRITTVGAQGWPHPLWHHDGRDPLRALVRWSDIEK